MEKRVIWRGMLAGATAGVLAFVFARIFLEPVIGRAIDYEGGRGEAESAMTGVHEHEMEVFTRGVQANIGMGFGVLAFSVAMGALFSVAFIVAYTRFATASVRAQSLAMAAVAFVVVYFVPFLKYPANPPSIGEPETIGVRTALYFEMILIAVAALVLAVLLGRSLLTRLGGWNASLIATLGFIGIVASVQFVLPDVNEVPDDFPAVVLWRFRLASLGTQLVLWASFSVIFGVLAERAFFALRPSSRLNQ